MNVYEYQAKKLLRSYGVAVPPGDVAGTPAQAEAVARTLHGPTWMVKAQIHAGGRGPAGGVQAVHTPEDARTVAEHMLGSQLATSQTRPQGQIVHKVYIEQGCEIVRAFYVALLLDSQDETLTFLASPERGGDRPRTERMVVVFPAPFGPSSATTSASPTLRDGPNRAWVSPWKVSIPDISSIRRVLPGRTGQPTCWPSTRQACSRR